MFLNMLEVRIFIPEQIIAEECDECLEMLFVESGIYSIGYLINNRPKLRLRFGVPTVIGGFQLAYKRRYDFIYKTYVEMRCLSMKRRQWMQIEEAYPDFITEMKIKLWTHYS